jgi:hypothetical protein
MANQPRSVRYLDRLFDRFLGVLQLFDDLADFEEDAWTGQVNAVLVAGKTRSSNGSKFHTQARRGAFIVSTTARAELKWIRSQCRQPDGYFARTCDYLIGSGERFQRQTIELAEFRLAEQVCAQLLRVDAAPISRPRAYRRVGV